MDRTMIQCLIELPEPYRTEALNNIPENTPNYMCRSVCDALARAFVWWKTPQGTNYWMEIFISFLQKLHNDQNECADNS